MSLLLDALKKSGQARPETSADTPSNQDNSRLPSEPAPETAPHLTLENMPEPPRQKPAREDEDDLARMSGHNLFAVKDVTTRPRLSIVPLALIAGLLFAAGGGYYVWREITPAPAKPLTNPSPAPASMAPSASPAPDAAPIGPASIAGIPPALEANPGTPKRTPVLANPIRQAVAPKTPQPIRIEHTKVIATVDPILLAGYQAYRDGNLDKARQHYEDTLRKDANNRDALLGLAAIAQQQSQDAAAAQYYRKVLALDPRDPVAHAGMSTLIGSTDMTGTESRLKLLLSQKPQSVELHFALGNLYAEQSRWNDAQQSYFEAARRAPEDARIAYNLAVSLDHLEQRKLAAQYYQRALQLSPANAADFNRAQVQQRAQDLTTP